MPKDEKQQQKDPKVTDRRIFTPDGDIRDEFRNDIRPAEPSAAKPAEETQLPEAAKPPEAAAAPEKPASSPPPPEKDARQEARERRRTMSDKANNPGTPFTNFIEPLIAQAYMFLGMLRDPYQKQPKIDTASSRQMIDILQLLQEKTKGNLTDDEEDFLETHLAELKLAYVQRTKSI